MSFSQQNRRLNEEPEYRYAFLTTKNGNSTRRFRTCTFVNLQFLFLLCPYLLRTYVYALHDSHYCINCTVILIF